MVDTSVSQENSEQERSGGTLPPAREDEKPEDIATSQPEQVGPKVETVVDRFAEAAKRVSLTPEAAQKIDELHKRMGLAESEEEKKRIWLAFYEQNKDVVELLQQKPRAEEPGEGDKSEQQQKNAEKLREHMEKVQEGVIRNLQSEVKRIVGATLSPEEKTNQLREQISKLRFPPELVEKMVQQLTAEGVTTDQIDGIITQQVNQNFTVVAEAMYDVEQYKALSGKLRGLGETEQPNGTQLLQETAEITSDFLDSLDVPGIIDLIFAVDRGFGGYGGKIDRRSEAPDQEKEQNTFRILDQIFANQDGVKLFFSTFAELDENEVFEGAQLLRRLETIFSSLESENAEQAREDVKKKLSSAVEAASYTPELAMLKLTKEQINLSADVIKIILIMAKKFTQKTPSGT